MELDEDKKRKLELLLGKRILETDRVCSLVEVPQEIAMEAIQLFSKRGYSILAIMYLRYMSSCSLKDAVDFLNQNQDASSSLDGSTDTYA